MFARLGGNPSVIKFYAKLYKNQYDNAGLKEIYERLLQHDARPNEFGVKKGLTPKEMRLDA